LTGTHTHTHTPLGCGTVAAAITHAYPSLTKATLEMTAGSA